LHDCTCAPSWVPETRHVRGASVRAASDDAFDAPSSVLVIPKAWRSLPNLGYIESSLQQCEATLPSPRFYRRRTGSKGRS